LVQAADFFAPLSFAPKESGKKKKRMYSAIGKGGLQRKTKHSG
jgi:hypothetical protein